MHALAFELTAALGMTVVTVLVHLVGLTNLIRLADLHLRKLRTPWLGIDRLLVPLVMVTALLLIHVVEVGAYAALYRWVGAEPTWEAAIYLSASAYGTSGWMGLDLAPGWRVLASFESLNGLLLVGWSTAFLFQTLHRILVTEEHHPLPEGAIAKEPEEEVVVPKTRARRPAKGAVKRGPRKAA